MPEVDAFPWPKPAEADENPAPLFDSRRDYIDQIAVYKRHQGKPTARRPRRKADAARRLMSERPPGPVGAS